VGDFLKTIFIFSVISMLVACAPIVPSVIDDQEPSDLREDTGIDPEPIEAKRPLLSIPLESYFDLAALKDKESKSVTSMEIKEVQAKEVQAKGEQESEIEIESSESEEIEDTGSAESEVVRKEAESEEPQDEIDSSEEAPEGKALEARREVQNIAKKDFEFVAFLSNEILKEFKDTGAVTFEISNVDDMESQVGLADFEVILSQKDFKLPDDISNSEQAKKDIVEQLYYLEKLFKTNLVRVDDSHWALTVDETVKPDVSIVVREMLTKVRVALKKPN